MRDSDRVFFMQRHQHFRIAIAQVIHQTVMQPPVTGAGVERNIINAKFAEHLRNGVAAPAHLKLSGVDWLLHGVGRARHAHFPPLK